MVDKRDAKYFGAGIINKTLSNNLQDTDKSKKRPEFHFPHLIEYWTRFELQMSKKKMVIKRHLKFWIPFH